MTPPCEIWRPKTCNTGGLRVFERDPVKLLIRLPKYISLRNIYILEMYLSQTNFSLKNISLPERYLPQAYYSLRDIVNLKMQIAHNCRSRRVPFSKALMYNRALAAFILLISRALQQGQPHHEGILKLSFWSITEDRNIQWTGFRYYYNHKTYWCSKQMMRERYWIYIWDVSQELRRGAKQFDTNSTWLRYF